MIEGISAQTILPKEVLPTGNQTVIPTPAQGDVDTFKSILQQAEISKSGDLKIGSANPSEASVIQKLTALDNGYRATLEQKQQISNLLMTPANQEGNSFKIRTTADLVDTTSSPENALLTRMKENMQTNLEKIQAINDRIVNIQTWSANHSIFMAVMKQTSDGFKTLFRSSG
jgi:hypothetical protein